MKKLFFIVTFIAFALSSCSSDDGQEDVTYELLPIQEVTLPSTFKTNQDNIIEVRFLRPTTCHGFNSFYYEKEGMTRTVAVEAIVFNGNECEPLTESIATQNLKFRPEATGEYTFKFWQGKDEQGTDIFLTFQILVEQ
ncbi:hypothetical protein [Flavobacterium suncheonense]|uniref:hypothetical protein n=1 Tax=Flavobacterium suncheonense TaxID=350894 RepID=UPI00068891C4|nr:hypothetical protein [Flavobacterium suncheonense]